MQNLNKDKKKEISITGKTCIMLYLPIKNGKECKHRNNLLLQYMF